MTPEEQRKHIEHIDQMLEDVQLRAEFEFEETWLQMQRDPIFCALIDARLLANVKKIVKHGFLSGAKSGVLILLEKVAQEIVE